MSAYMMCFSNRLVERFGAAWGYLGWVLWLPWALFLLSAGQVEAGHAYGRPLSPIPPGMLPVLVVVAVIVLLWGVLWLAWWLFDVIDRQVEAWKIGGGFFLLVLGTLPLLGVSLGIYSGAVSWIALLPWLAYWIFERE
ncbi:MAG TPA: hypothetical protein VKU00_29655 [Chthonomonadaceae bacterium]|nr:hypothetical protein [Chthonomonadaceae bacterium]